jgi:hypothetical protein
MRFLVLGVLTLSAVFIMQDATDGESIIAKATWDRGREYTAFFRAHKPGTYQLNCGTHAPSMTARILVLPRERQPA